MGDIFTGLDPATAETLAGVVTAYGMSVLGGIAILIVGWIAAGWIAAAVRRWLSRLARVDEMLRGFLANLAKYTVLAFVVIAVLNQFGIQTASLIAIFGAAGLAIGLALQGTLTNVAAGVMLLLFRPVKVGQYVEVAGRAGTVKSLDLFTTELATPDNVQIIVPNAAVWGAAVVNYSHHAERRVDFTIGVAYDTDLDAAIETLRKVVEADPRALSEPAPMFIVGNLGDSAVELIVRVWMKADDVWPFKFDNTKAFKEALDAAGIVIPFPQRDVHLYQTQTA